MHSNDRNRQRLAARSFRPHVEMLENRLTPASVSSVTPSPALVADATVGNEKFSLTVTYDAAMNTAFNPTITFPVENPSTTLTFSSGLWTDNTHFVAKYNVADANTMLPNVDVKVSGGKAADTTVPADFTAADNFGIDTENPTVTSVTMSRRIVSDNDVGKKFVIDVVFSEAMDQTVTPQVRFAKEKPGATLRHVSGAWRSSTAYRDVFNVRDVNVLLDKIGIRVSGAKDAAGNTQREVDKANQFRIDTRNPKVVSFAPIGFDAGAGILRFGLVFNLPVTGLDLADLRLETNGLSGAAIQSITGSGAEYQIDVFVGNGFGNIRLKLIDDNSIRYLKNHNRLEGVGQADGSLATNSIELIRFGRLGFLL